MPEEIQLTPEQQAQYDSAAGPVLQEAPAATPSPVEINPIRDFNAAQLAELAVQDKEGFDIVGEFRRNQDLWADAATIQKTADALDLIKERGFELSDLPGPKKIGQTILESAKGFGKQLWNYGSAAVGMVQGALTEPFSEDLATGFAEGAAQNLAKNIAGTEEAMAGLSQIPGKVVSKVGRLVGPARTPEQKVADLWKAVGISEVQQQRVSGQGPFTQAVTGGVAGELNPEEVATLAAGDPFSFVTFSKAFQLGGKLVPGAVRSVTAKVGEKVGDAAAVVGGRAVQTAGKLTEIGGSAAKTIAPAVGLIKGTIEAGPVGALAGLKAGEIAASVAKKVSTAGAKVAEVGKQVAGATPIVSPLAQAGRDVLQSAPGALGTVGIGLGQDIGLSALTSETPAETEGAIGIGTALGAAGALGRVGSRVISGQLVAPREYGVNTITPSSGNFPTLETAHSQTIRAATPGEQTRLNAVRLFAKGASPGTDVFFIKGAATLRDALTQSGVSSDTAAQYSEQSGFFTVSLPDKSGTPRRVIVARDVEAAPHESFHAIQDVLGEVANRELDKVVRSEYADRWEQEGQRYAARLVEGGAADWRETILDQTGWGHAEAVEKLSNAIANEVIGQTGAEADSGFVQDRVRAEWARIAAEARQRNPQARPEQLWREVLSPEEATQVADRYLARELAAENFDVVFKNLGAALESKQSLPRRLARVAARLITTLGGEPLAGRRSEIGQIEPRFGVTQAVTQAGRGQRTPPVIEPKSTARQPVSVPTTQQAQQDAVAQARTIAAEAPDTIASGGTRSAKELLGEVAEAIAQRAGVKINYLSAPGEPAAATTSNRAVRREIIEAFRTMPAEARELWEKSFFPERIIRTKNGKYQVLGWAPEIFAANAHKLAGWLAEHTGVASPYAVDVATRTFTPDAWQQLFADTQQFVRNQQAGATGAGETLVVPENIRERGFTAPARTGGESTIAQDRADVINMLFGIRIPETPRIQKGKLPRNIAAQEVSTATQPGRVEVPVRPRGEFTGIEAAAQDIAGRSINEVNPFRQLVEKAGNPPSLIEAVQRLNLENIKEVALAAEQPQFRGNEFVLAAGFQPSANPRAVKTAAVRDDQGRIFEGSWHGEAVQNAIEGRARNVVDEGFVTNSGEYLSRDEAFRRAEELNQLTKDTAATPRQDKELETDFFNRTRQFQPVAETARRLTEMTPEEWTNTIKDYRGKLGGGLTGWAFDIGASAKDAADVTALRETVTRLQELAKSISISEEGGFDRKMDLIGRAQAAREAFEAATGSNLEGTGAGSAVPFITKHIDPTYKPPVPPSQPVKVAAQPRTEGERRVGTGFTKFFTDVTQGTFGKSDKPFVPVQDLSGFEDVVETKTKHSGNFDDHIAKSIPIFYETQIQKAKAISDSLPEGGRVLDIAASEGSFGKTISELSDGAVETVSLDPNEAMAEFFEKKSQVPGATYSKEAFLNGFESEGVDYPAHDGGPYDVVTESMGFQFIDPDRASQVAEAKRLLKPNGVFLTEQKVRNPQWAANEKKKDAQFKSKYFSTDELSAKDKTVGFAQSRDEVKSVGMVDNMADQQSLEAVLTSNFKHVVQYWDSGNFKGYAASDNAAELNRIVERLGDTNSEFSTDQMPRRVEQTARDDFEFQVGQQQFQPSLKADVDGLIEEGRLQFQAQKKKPAKNTPVPEKIKAYHFSEAGDKLKFSNPAKMRESVDKFWGKENPKTFFFVEGSELDPGDRFHNRSVYEAEINKADLYDVTTGDDPLGFFGINREEADYAIRKAGYKGVLIPIKGGQQVVIMYDKTPIKYSGEIDADGNITKTQFQPKRAEQSETLFDLPATDSFPEAVKPKRGQKDIHSDIVGSPLFKQAKTKEAAISLFADKLKQEAKRQEANPAFALGKRWYSEFTPELRREFGADAELMAELLAATSPQTSVETNFGYAIDALNNWKAGKYDKLIEKWNDGYRRLEDGSLAKIYKRDVAAGKVENAPEKPSDATYMAHWILKHDLLPKGTSGAQIGWHSKNVAKVFARRWLSETKGPKTKNFVQNLLGSGDEATIDIWADRLLRRVGYEGLQEKWRILPEHARGVSDEDFAFGQAAFRQAADALGMKPSDLQAALWFTEKQRWADNGWSAKLDLGDFRTEIKRTAAYRAGFEAGKGPGEVRAQARQPEPEYEQLGLEITPRRVRLR